MGSGEAEMMENKLEESDETYVYVNRSNRWTASLNADYSLALLDVSGRHSLS